MNVKRINAILAVVAVLTVPMAVVLSISYSMAMESDGVMENCLFGGTASVCPMSLFEHLSSWQNMFVANLPKVAALYLFLFLVLIGLHLASSDLQLMPSKLSKSIQNQKLYLKQKPNILLFDDLRLAFTQGLLEPKIY